MVENQGRNGEEGFDHLKPDEDRLACSAKLFLGGKDGYWREKWWWWESMKKLHAVEKVEEVERWRGEEEIYFRERGEKERREKLICENVIFRVNSRIYRALEFSKKKFILIFES